MINLTAVVIARNEAHQIERCLGALKQVANEIVLVDSGSTDNTAVLARLLGANVVEYNWQGYAQNKNYGNALAQSDWILSIDADEVLSEELIQSIQQLQVSENEVYALDRINNYCGTWVKYSGWYPDWKPRIFNRKQVQWQGDFVHETLFVPSYFKMIKLKGKLWHYSYNSPQDHIRKVSEYAGLSAKSLFQKGKKSSFFKIWFYPIIRFLKTYLLKLGFLDGRAGLSISRYDAYLVHLKYKQLKALHAKN